MKKQNSKLAFKTMPRTLKFDLDGGAWQALSNPHPYDFVAREKERGLFVVVSYAPFSDGKQWLHVSVSREDRVPNYEELAEVKRRFIGADKKAIMVFPSEKNHVNIHENCLHLYHCLDTDPLPEFSGVVNGKRRI